MKTRKMLFNISDVKEIEYREEISSGLRKTQNNAKLIIAVYQEIYSIYSEMNKNISIKQKLLNFFHIK